MSENIDFLQFDPFPYSSFINNHHLFDHIYLDNHNMEVLSLSSSGVGTTSGSQSGSAGSSAITPTGEPSSLSSGRHQSPGQRCLIMPGMHVVCIENYTSNPHEERCLSIVQGDIIEGKYYPILSMMYHLYK